TGNLGQAVHQASAALDFASKRFDRAVYSEITRMVGTMRTVMPAADYLEALLQYQAQGGKAYLLRYVVRASDWDAFIKGEIGASADSFTLAELGGNASGWMLYATPDYGTPLFRFKKGDNPSALAALRLSEGQYILQVDAAHAPAKVKLNYLEHLPQ